MSKINEVKLARTAANRMKRVARNEKAIAASKEKVLTVPRGSARVGRDLAAVKPRDVVNTVLRNAFESIQVQASAFTDKGKEIAGMVHDAIMSKAGKAPLVSHIGLSFRTHKVLVNEGIMPQADGSYLTPKKQEEALAV